MGDPVCWLHRVCDGCGAFVEERDAVTCPRCGSVLPGDEEQLT